MTRSDIGKVSKKSPCRAHGGIGSVHVSALENETAQLWLLPVASPNISKVIVKKGWKILNRYLNIGGLGEKG
jgi:hypothetical protein